MNHAEWKLGRVNLRAEYEDIEMLPMKEAIIRFIELSGWLVHHP